MSSFIHSHRHFNSVERAIQNAVVGSTSFWTYQFKRAYKIQNEGIDRQWEVVSEFMDTIRELSVLCVSLQYKHHYEGVLDVEIQQNLEFLSSNKTEIVKLSDVELYKAMQSIYYQIETEHLADLRELSDAEKKAFEMLSVLKADIAESIIASLEEYSEAKSWSL